jgi:nucleotide-binding universal stress UspA family protein
MSRFNSILVPVDFSGCSDAALDAAVELAQKLGAKLRLVHVYHPPTLMFDPYGIQPAEPFLLEAPEAARKRLEQELKKVEAAGVQVEADVRQGVPAEEIVAEARECGADLIVMGTHGHTGLEHVLLGSVAERTVRLSDSPVLTVKPRS